MYNVYRINARIGWLGFPLSTLPLIHSVLSSAHHGSVLIFSIYKTGIVRPYTLEMYFDICLKKKASANYKFNQRNSSVLSITVFVLSIIAFAFITDQARNFWLAEAVISVYCCFLTGISIFGCILLDMPHFCQAAWLQEMHCNTWGCPISHGLLSFHTTLSRCRAGVSWRLCCSLFSGKCHMKCAFLSS